MKKLEDKVALVTGGSTGIGRASALAFAREGASVVIADIHVEVGREIVQQIEKAGGNAIFTRTDVSQTEQVQVLIEKAVETYGRLDRPEEVTETVVWLCSKAASFLTGIVMPIDGGFIAQ